MPQIVPRFHVLHQTNCILSVRKRHYPKLGITSKSPGFSLTSRSKSGIIPPNTISLRGGRCILQNPIKVIVLRAGGALLLAVGIILIFSALVFLSYLGVLGVPIVAFGGSVLFATGTMMYNHARRLTLVRQNAILTTEGAVVYLRSFGEDSMTEQGVSAAGLGGVITEEEQLVQALSSAGPVIAVGEPDEQLPLLGATRLHFSQDEWQQGVSKLLREGSLVVIRPGSFSTGVRWEIQQALRLLPPQRLLMVVGGRAGRHQDDDLAQFTAKVDPMLPQPLPTSYGRKRLYRFGSIRAFVHFDDGWMPTLHPITLDLVPWFRRTVTHKLVPYYRNALRPMLTSLGSPPPPLPFSGLVSVFVGIGLIFLLFALEVLKRSSWRR